MVRRRVRRTAEKQLDLHGFPLKEHFWSNFTASIWNRKMYIQLMPNLFKPQQNFNYREGAEKTSPTRCQQCLHYRSRCPSWLEGRRWHCLLRRWAAHLPSQTPAGSGRPERCSFPPHCSPTAGRKKHKEQTQQTQTNSHDTHKRTGPTTGSFYWDWHPVRETILT